MSQIDSVGNITDGGNVGVIDFVVDMDATGNIGIEVFGIMEVIHMRKTIKETDVPSGK